MGLCHLPCTACSGRGLKCLFTAMTVLWWNSLVPSGMLPGILSSYGAAKPSWLMFCSACMGSSTSLWVGEKQSVCHPNQCFKRCLYLLDWWSLDPLPPQESGLPPPTERPFPLFIVLLQSVLSSESILWG